jgi:membrane fusion protein (multidrug efflux system)
MKYTMLPIAAALFILSGCDNAQTSAPPQVTPEVGVVTLKSQPVSVISELTGRTTASLSAEVRPQVGGIIQKRLFTEGDMVKAGQALYQIDPSSYRAAYNEAAAALKQAQSLVTSDCQKAQRYAALVKDNGVSRQDADDALSTCNQDKASVESKKAALESARINLNWTTVTAPIAGRIGISSVTPGALVSADQDTALATIRGLDTMYVDLTAPASICCACANKRWRPTTIRLACPDPGRWQHLQRKRASGVDRSGGGRIHRLGHAARSLPEPAACLVTGNVRARPRR